MLVRGCRFFGDKFIEPASPRAIDATKVARFSERIGRACSGDIPSARKSHGPALILSFAKRPQGRRVGSRLLAIASLCFGKLDDQLFRLDLIRAT